MINDDGIVEFDEVVLVYLIDVRGGVRVVFDVDIGF